jgi:hypothetical protein
VFHHYSASAYAFGALEERCEYILNDKVAAIGENCLLAHGGLSAWQGATAR